MSEADAQRTMGTFATIPRMLCVCRIASYSSSSLELPAVLRHSSNCYELNRELL